MNNKDRVYRLNYGTRNPANIQLCLNSLVTNIYQYFLFNIFCFLNIVLFAIVVLFV